MYLFSDGGLRQIYKIIVTLLVSVTVIANSALPSTEILPHERSDLAVESRFKPFLKTPGLNFKDIATVTYVAEKIFSLFAGPHIPDEVTVRRQINNLNRLSAHSNIRIDEEPHSRNILGREYRYVVVNFLNVDTVFDLIFLNGYEKLTAEERLDLRLALNIRDEENLFLDFPGLEGVRLINHIRAPEQTSRNVDIKQNDKLGYTEHPAVEFALSDPVINKWDYVKKEGYKIGVSADGFMKPSEYISIAENFVREENGFMEETFNNIFGKEYKRDNVAKVRIEFIGEGGLKMAFLVKLKMKDGGNFAFSIKMTKPWIYPDERNNILSSIYSVWRKLSGKALEHVSRFGALKTVYLKDFRTEIMVMSQEYIYGPTLKDILDHSTLPYAKKVLAVKDAVACYMEAQRYGIPINDPKPENICLAYDTKNVWKIMDLDKIFTGPETAQTIIRSPEEYMELLRTYYGRYLDDYNSAEPHATDSADVHEFLRSRLITIKNTRPHFIRAATPSELYKYLGITKDMKDPDNERLRSDVAQYFGSLGLDSELYASRITVGSTEYIWLSCFIEAENISTDIFAEYFYVNRKRAAHGFSDVNSDSTKLQMGIDDISLRGSGHMKVFFDVRQQVIYKLFRPSKYAVPRSQISSWDAFFFYVRKGYLPMDAPSREKVIEKFIRPWLRDPKFRIDDPDKIFGQDFIDRCGPEFEIDLSRNTDIGPSAQMPNPGLSAAIDEAKMIHDENMKMAPAIAENTILCHIITDSILPDGQRNTIRQVERQMRENNYKEKIICLSDPANADLFIDELKAVMARNTAIYKGCNVEFDVACPSSDIVKRIQNSDLGIKAAAFEPCSEPAQIEGVMLALRALRTGDINKLKMIFEMLSGVKLDLDRLGIKDIEQFAAKVVFILPAAKQIEYEGLRRLNEIISKNICSAA